MIAPVRSILRRLTLSILAAGAVLSGFAQDTVEIKALCFPKLPGKSTIEILVGKEEVIEVSLQSHEFTLPQQIPRLAEWQLGKSGTDSEGRFTFHTYARVTPLASNKQLLILIRKGADHEDGFAILPLDPAKVQGRNYVILNLTTVPIAGVVGGQKFKLAPSRRAVLKPEANRGENLCFASLNYEREGKWRSFFSSNWRLREGSRVLILVHQAPGQRTPRFHSVIDPL